MRQYRSWAISLAGLVGVVAACGSKNGSGFENNNDNNNSADGGGGGDEAGLFGLDASLGGSDGATPPHPTGDPKTCDDAAKLKTYIGCDYWPTVVANNVWSIFDFAAVVANAGDTPADITVTGPNGTNQKTTVQPQELVKIYLPWVSDLKGPDADCAGAATPLKSSVSSLKGAYHLVSSVPVTVYQFNALEYEGKGGPSGKDWSSCPGLKQNPDPLGQPCVGVCLSFSNDASLLLPSTAMTGNYRITGIHGWTEFNPFSGPQDVMGAYFAVTGTADGTKVTVKVSGGGQVVAGGQISATGPGGLLNFTLNAGDVAEIVGPLGAAKDLSGSQVAADKPVQVITGIPCINLPAGQSACDHVEESVLPAETLGKHYVVTVPTAPKGGPIGHVVRVYGNVDGTKLQGLPSSCPGGSVINAGQVIDCGVVNQDFEVTGDHEFAVSSFMLGSAVVDPPVRTESQGDPSQSQMIAVEQFRTKYIFLAPDDYETNYIDIAAPSGTQLTLDGANVGGSFKAVGSGGLGVVRAKLAPGKAGAHVITGDKPFGIQVLGYGRQTSYQYPGGLDLYAIAPPPPPPR
jgi:hypothetical protein